MLKGWTIHRGFSLPLGEQLVMYAVAMAIGFMLVSL